jgi:hypothetical protein
MQRVVSVSFPRSGHHLVERWQVVASGDPPGREVIEAVVRGQGIAERRGIATFRPFDGPAATDLGIGRVMTNRG